MTRVALLADLHGNFQLPPPKQSDLFLFAGDFFARRDSDYKRELLEQHRQLPLLLRWLKKIPATKIFFIAGNHDYLLHTLGPDVLALLLQEEGISATYLENSSATWKGLSIWGTPHVASSPDGSYPRSPAFVLHPDDYQERVILPPSDIILSHNSPWYDFEKEEKNFIDSEKAARHLRAEILRSNPELFVSGHFHWMRGERKIGSSTVIVPSAVGPYIPGEPDYQLVSRDPYLYFDLSPSNAA
jgi:Icc-related predicted phosphoesterase